MNSEDEKDSVRYRWLFDTKTQEKRDDLIADIGSAAYKKEMEKYDQ